MTDETKKVLASIAAPMTDERAEVLEHHAKLGGILTIFPSEMLELVSDRREVRRLRALIADRKKVVEELRDALLDIVRVQPSVALAVEAENRQLRAEKGSLLGVCHLALEDALKGLGPMSDGVLESLQAVIRATDQQSVARSEETNG